MNQWLIKKVRLLVLPIMKEFFDYEKQMMLAEIGIADFRRLLDEAEKNDNQYVSLYSLYSQEMIKRLRERDSY